MAQNISWLGNEYTGVGFVALPKTGGGEARFDDASVTTAVAADVASGKIFLSADGAPTTGTGSGGGGAEYTRTVAVAQQTVTMGTVDSHTAAYLSTAVNTFESGADYIVTFNGTEYWYTCQNGWYGSILGELNYLWGTDTAQVYPFLIQDYSTASSLLLLTYDGYVNTNVSIKVEKVELLSGGTTLTTKSITQNGTYSASDDNADGYSSVTVNVSGGSPTLQTKTATPTTSQQTITPDSGYDGLSQVTVNAIPSEYIIPTGNLAITQNGTGIDVAQYSTVSVTVSGGSVNIGTVTTTNSSNQSTSINFTLPSGRTPKAFFCRLTEQIARTSGSRYYYVFDMRWDGSSNGGVAGNTFYMSSGTLTNVTSGYSKSQDGTTYTLSSTGSRSASPGSFFNGTYELVYVY